MELLYAFGIVCITILQDRCEDWEWLIDILNHVFNPTYLMEYVFPLVAGYDSVFGAQLLLSIAFGGWLNTMMKWMMVEDRPFWWVRETTYYGNGERPFIRQNEDTCETGPGSPSGHCAAASTIFILSQMWLSHIVADLKSEKLAALHEKLPVKTVYFSMMSLIGIARMYIGAHFPHQCLMGAMVGSFLSPSLCLFITDPYLLRTSDPQEVKRAFLRHLALAGGAALLAGLLGLVYYFIEIDIHWSTRLAFRWCQSAQNINVKTSPIFAIVQTTGSLLGWALAVTPEVAKYRHNTPTRNCFVATLTTLLAMYTLKHIQDEYIPPRRVPFYSLHFVLNLVRPFIYLRILPKVAMATYFGPLNQSEQLQVATTGGVKRK